MPSWIYAQNHIGWAPFAWLVYTGVLVLVIDYIWRRITIPARRLVSVAAVLWLVGLLVIGLVF